MTMDDRFSRQAWDRNSQTYELIRQIPFNAELAAGTLSETRFKHYLTQDAHYLIGFGRALALAAAKAPQPDRKSRPSCCFRGAASLPNRGPRLPALPRDTRSADVSNRESAWRAVRLRG